MLELETLQVLVDKELNFKPQNRWRVPDYFTHVRPLIITINTYLTEKRYNNKDERREIRLYIYQRITRREIRTTYDLSAYQCGVILGYLQESGSFSLSADGKRLLEFLAKEFEGQAVLGKVGGTDADLLIPDEVSGLPDMSSAPF